MRYGKELSPFAYADERYRKIQVGCYKREPNADGMIEAFYAAPTWVKVRDGEASGAMLSLDRDEAQVLIDQLWAAGLRPNESHGSVGQLEATQRHLADMQLISQKLLAKVLA